MDIFPRILYKIERELLFSILPPVKPGYKIYREKINNKYIIGYGRFGETNLVLGDERGEFNIQDASSSIFAAGSIAYNEGEIDISINEEIDNKIEFDISPKEYPLLFEKKEIKKWNYSDWIPGQKSPKENSKVREITITPDKYILAISTEDKRIWIYEFDSGINYLIPLSNFYNQLMIQKNIRDPKIALKPNLFFGPGKGNMGDYTNTELRNTFLTYNKYLKKLDIQEDLTLTKPQKSKNKLFRIFNNGK